MIDKIKRFIKRYLFPKLMALREIHGKDLVDLLKSKDSKLQHKSPSEPEIRDFDKYSVSPWIFGYDDGTRVAVALLEWESSLKNDSEDHIKLVAVDLSQGGHFPETLDGLMQMGNVVMPDLLKGKYHVTDGEHAKKIYTDMKEVPLGTTYELGTVLGQNKPGPTLPSYQQPSQGRRSNPG